ncbi:hypothetical protein [Amycolatopsis sp. cmx-4-68]|uniref:hypothetical protein n=1 Tax=Amycolatopsis sp. cmx-4-68 TaxID=2790938 RepID=UPI00397ABDD1
MFFRPEITPPDFALPENTRGRIYHLLERIGSSRAGWRGGLVESIRVRRLIGGGRSGAVVLDIVLCAGSERRQRVVKMGPTEEMSREYANFRRFLRDYPTAICAPIQEVTDGAREPAPDDREGFDAVVYAHVEDYAGRPEAPACTLEDVVASAFEGDAADLELSQRLVEALFAGMATPFHNRRKILGERSLRDLNPTLGPDLVVEAGEVTAEPSYPEDVFQHSLGPETFVPGSPIVLFGSSGSDVRVRVLPTGPAADRVAGTVVGTRFADRRAHFEAAFTTFERAGRTVFADGTGVADPALGLRRALTDPELGRVRGVVHGDLNARNVMCVDARPVLIDFAKTADGQPVFADAAWLEISLIRDVFSKLSHSELVKVQRLLALAHRLRRPAVGEELAGFFDGPAKTAFLVLLAIRSSAARSYPKEIAAWRDYLAQLHLKSYRTAKWTGDVQTAAKLRAVHAVAAVATEWLAETDPFERWPDCAMVLRALAPLVDLDDPDAVDVVAGLAAADRTRSPGAAAIDPGDLGSRYARRHFSAKAWETLVGLSREHDSFVGPLPEGLDDAVVLAGGAGVGKSRVLRELAYRAAADVVRPEADGAARMPVLVDAAELLEGRSLEEGLGLPPASLVLGAVSLLVDGVDDLVPDDQDKVFGRVGESRARFPRTPVLIASRLPARAAEAGVRAVLLRAWSRKRSLRFFTTQSDVLFAEEDMRRLGGELRSLGPVSPALLTTYVEVARRNRRAVSLTDVYREYFAARVGTLDRAALINVAVRSVDRGAPVRPVEPVAEFVEQGLLRQVGESVLFTHGFERDFFAACSFADADEPFLRERARRFAWRPVSRLAAQLPEVPDEVVDILADAVTGADPVFAAQLLGRRSSAYGAEFTRIQAAILRDPLSGRFAALSAVRALVVLGTSEALRSLERELTRPPTSPGVLCDALATLAVRHGHLDEDLRVPGDWLRALLGRLLHEDLPADVVLGAVDAIKSQRTTGLELLLADLAEAGTPVVAQAADAALAELGTVLPRPLRTRRRELVATRLATVEERLPTLSVDGDIRSARAERIDLLRRLGDPDVLLARLYAYGMHFDIAEALDGMLDDPVDLTGVQRLADLDIRTLNALVHRILAAHSELCDELVFAADSGSPVAVLLAAATALRSPASVEHAACLVAELAEVETGEKIEGLAALAHAVVAVDPVHGFEVSRRAARRLQERAIPARLYWPWTTMLAHTHPSPGELDVLLAGDVRDAIGETARACTAFDGAPRETVNFSPAACAASCSKRKQPIRSRERSRGALPG